MEVLQEIENGSSTSTAEFASREKINFQKAIVKTREMGRIKRFALSTRSRCSQAS
jgi:hypothetical protein